MLKQLKLISTLITLVFSMNSFAQVSGGTHQKLFDLYILGEYEKCADKATKMTENDKTKYDSEPYLWVSMCMVRLSEDPEMEQYYPDAIKQSLKYGAKFKKRDDRLKSKDQDYIFEENIEFINELKAIAIGEGKGLFVQDDYRKAVGWYKMGMNLDPDDPTMKMMKGVADLYNKNKKEGQLAIDQALESFNALAKEGGFESNSETVIAFEDAFIYYAEYLSEQGNKSEAANIAKLARELDPENKKFERLQKNMAG